MDLSAFDTADLANTGAVMELRAPDGTPALQDDGSPITLTLLGEDSDLLTKLRNQQTNAYLRGGPSAKITAEMAQTQEIARFAKATVDWSGVKVDGKALDCTEDNVREVYRKFPWVRDQVRAFIGDRARFMKGSQTS